MTYRLTFDANNNPVFLDEKRKIYTTADMINVLRHKAAKAISRLELDSGLSRNTLVNHLKGKSNAIKPLLIALDSHGYDVIIRKQGAK